MSNIVNDFYDLETPAGRIKIAVGMDQAERAIVYVIEHGERKFPVKVNLDYIRYRNLENLVLRETIFAIAYAFATQDECPCKIENGWLDLDSSETSRPWPVREKKSWIEYL